MSNEITPRPALGKPTIVPPPKGYSGSGFMTTKVRDIHPIP